MRTQRWGLPEKASIFWPEKLCLKFELMLVHTRVGWLGCLFFWFFIAGGCGIMNGMWSPFTVNPSLKSDKPTLVL